MGRNIYNEKVWVDTFIHEAPEGDVDKERVDVVAEAVPPDVRNFLEVGVGGGYVFRRIKERSGAAGFGFDLSADLVAKLRDPRVCVGDVAAIPFRSGTFDLVLAADVLEHLDDAVFAKSIAEIVRVSRKYVLINSPYKGTVEWAVAFCNKCGNEFNVYGHTRSIDLSLIRRVFPKDRFEIVSVKLFGKKWLPRPSFLVQIARRWGKVYSTEGVLCPRCFNTTFIYPPRNAIEIFIGKAICGMLVLADKMAPSICKCGSEIRVLLKKKGS